MRVTRPIALIALCAACRGWWGDSTHDESVESTSEVQNAGAPYRAAIEAAAEHGVLTLTVQLYDGQTFSAEPLELGTGDRLAASVDGRELALAPDPSRYGSAYIAELPTDEPGTRISVTLQSKGLGNAAASVVLPDRFRMTAPGPDAKPVLDRPIELAWAGGRPGDAVQVTYKLLCAEGRQGGMQRVASGDAYRARLELVIDRLTGPCDVTLGVRRLSLGVMSGAWGGYAAGVQAQSEIWQSVEL